MKRAFDWITAALCGAVVGIVATLYYLPEIFIWVKAASMVYRP